ncbi:MAG: glycosyltransferase family 2 protein [Pseudomonadota bacterium]
MTSLKNLTAIIVCFDSAHIIGNALRLLESANIKTIVVDNGSSDNSVEIAKKYGAHVIENHANLGFGVANNIGVKAAPTPWVLMLNPDIEIDEASIRALLTATKTYDNIGIIAPRIVENDGRVFIQPRSLLSPFHLNQAKNMTPNGDCCLPFLSGACFLINRDSFLELGGFDENIFLFYEDDDLCRRFFDSSLSLIHIDGATALHARGKSTQPQKGRVFLARYHMAWSRIYVCRKYGIKPKSFADLLKNGSKYLLAALSFNRQRMERYGGSFMGNWDASFSKQHAKPRD